MSRTGVAVQVYVVAGRCAWLLTWTPGQGVVNRDFAGPLGGL